MPSAPRLLIRSLLALGAITAVGLAQAQSTRTWVSGVGDDVNSCSRSAPCKTFAGAISKTAPNGEISVLDSAGFGNVTITKPITIDGQGSIASVLVAGTNGININVGANDQVILRNLSITGLSTSTSALGLNGVKIAGTTGRVVIQNVTVERFAEACVDVASSKTQVVLDNVSLSQCVTNGVNIAPGADNPQVSVNRSRILHSPVGVNVAAAANVSIDQSHIAHATTGVKVTAGADVSIGQSQIVQSITGLMVDGAAAVVRLSDTTVTQNESGLNTQNGGVIESYNNNRLRGNKNKTTGEVTDGAPTTTYYQR